MPLSLGCHPLRYLITAFLYSSGSLSGAKARPHCNDPHLLYFPTSLSPRFPAPVDTTPLQPLPLCRFSNLGLGHFLLLFPSPRPLPTFPRSRDYEYAQMTLLPPQFPCLYDAIDENIAASASRARNSKITPSPPLARPHTQRLDWGRSGFQ